MIALALAAALLVLAAPGGASEPMRAFPAAGVPCPVRPGGGAPGAGGAAGEEGPARRATVERTADDLTVLRWEGVLADPVSARLPVRVQEGAVGLLVWAQARSGGSRIEVELFGPDGRLVGCEACARSPAVGEARPGRGSAQMPSTDRPGWELRPGRYEFRLRAAPVGAEPGVPGTALADVTVTFRAKASASMQRFLDLNFIYLPGCALSEEIARTSPEFAALLAKIDEVLEPAGIRLGRVTHRMLDRPEFSRIATWDEAGRLFETSGEVGAGRALNVYCVEGFDPPLNPAVGLAGGIPGPIVPGTTDSGIAIRTPPLFTCTDCIDAFGSLFAHEIGHYLGLYHTTEANLVREDPLSDTPRCRAPGLRDCPDWDHVMFPVIHAANRLWSPAQARIVRTHPLVYVAPVLRPAPRGAGAAERPLARPNPFGERVEIRLAGADAGERLRAIVVDVRGRRIRGLDGLGGLFSWDGRDEAGRRVPAGVYFVRVRGGGPERMVRIVKGSGG